MQSKSADQVVNRLTEAGYSGLFLSSEHNMADAIWQNGENRSELEQIVQNSNYAALVRILASELLYAKAPDYPPNEWQKTLANLYSQALMFTGVETGGLQFSGNQWGFLYHSDELAVQDYGSLGAHLINTGSEAVPHLVKLLDNEDTILYEGSQEATLGNSLEYRIKDAAAYYIGQITGIPVTFYEKTADRDAEIERLKAALQNEQ